MLYGCLFSQRKFCLPQWGLKYKKEKDNENNNNNNNNNNDDELQKEGWRARGFYKKLYLNWIRSQLSLLKKVTIRNCNNNNNNNN